MRGFYFDNRRCTGCRTCVLACADFHNHEAGRYFRRVIDYEGGACCCSEDGIVRADAFAYHISLACNHCADPACMGVCPTGAMHRDDFGLVWPDLDKCIGCGYCTMACPYHAPFIDATLKRSSKCDGCTKRVHEKKRPFCVDACPLRALDFGTEEELRERHADTWNQVVSCILPLPEAEYTTPNLHIAPSPAALLADSLAGKARAGRIANGGEL